MATFFGGTDGSPLTYSPYPGRVAKAWQHAPQFSGRHAIVQPSEALFGGPYFDTGSSSVFPPNTFFGAPRDEMGPGIDWFEDFHVIPRSFILGNVLSTQQIPVEVYSAFRNAPHSWNAWVNNAGAGITLLSAPSLPYVFAPQSGKQMQLQVSTSGAPKVDTTLDWVFDFATIYTDIQLNRVVLFGMPPELPYTEFLEFLTEVMEHKDGSEQRHALRKNPRQFFQWEVALDEGPERSRVENQLFDWQTRVFGIPVWHELTRLTSSATAGGTTVTVQSTDFADYRVGSLVLVYESATKFDVLTVLAFTSTTVTSTSPLLNTYVAGAIVAPLRTGVLDNPPAEQRFRVNHSRLQVVFRVLDNDSNLASTAAWPTFNSKVFLSDINVVRDTIAVSLQQEVIVLDNKTGSTYRDTPWAHNRRGSSKTFIANSRQGLWNIRQLMHSLRGRQVSFYLPTFAKDLELASSIVNGANTLSVTDVGYTQFVRQRQPRNVIRVVPNNGVSPITKTVTSSADAGATETLTVDSNWAVGLTAAQVDRVEFVEKVRLDSDRVRFDYNLGDRITKVSSPVKVVLE